jgi:hypothetical protein
MRSTRRHLLASALALATGTLLPAAARAAPNPDLAGSVGAGFGLASLAIGAAPADWRGVFAGDAAWTAPAGVPRGGRDASREETP